ncbi:MAG: glycosyltransferase [Planctomycetota bacterium]
MKRIALVYSTNPTRGIQGMDMIRWVAMGHRFRWLGHKVRLVTDRRRGEERLDRLHLSSAQRAEWDKFDAVKVCYQASIDLVEPHPNLIARMCRVVDEKLPERDDHRRAETLRQQQRIADLAAIVAFNDEENAARWRQRYGTRQQILIVPTGCPEKIPEDGANPYPDGKRIVLFSGSLTSHRFPGTLNELARRLAREAPDVQVHFLGKDSLQHYAGVSEPLDPRLVHVHPSVPEADTWRYVLHAHCGIALAPSEHAFESELSKIYYYLRGGLPVVTESPVPNKTVIDECAHGAVAAYDDMDDLVDKTRSALHLEPRSPAVMNYMAEHHSWSQRAKVYDDALQARWQCAHS